MWKFLKTEMLVILALTEDALRTDSEIADEYDLKKGTVSSARRRLLDAGAIQFAYVPAFNRLGCEMLGCHYGNTDPAVRPDVKANHYMEFCSRTPQIFFAIIGGNSVAFFTALRNATELESLVVGHNTLFAGEKSGSKAKLTHVLFPYALSRVMPVPQFAPIVHNYFELETPFPKRVQVSSMNCDRADLGPTDSKVFSALVANPSYSDRKIASLVNLSRQAVARMRRRYMEERLLTKICIPKLYRWGFEIYALSHAKYSPDFSFERRLKSQPREVMDRSFYSLSKSHEGVSNFMASKYAEYSERVDEVLGWYFRAKALEEGPKVAVFSLDRSTELRSFDYYPAVKQLLQSDAS